MSVRLHIRGRIDLDGTHRAVVETDSRELLGGHGDADVGYLRLAKGRKACACLLDEIREGTANVIWVDRLKQQALGARDTDSVEVEWTAPPEAKKLELRVAPDFPSRDLARLVGKPVAKGEKTAHYTLSGEPRPITVAETIPAGIVVVGAHTDIQISGTEGNEVPVTYADIGGLDRELKTIRALVEHPFRFPEIFEHMGVAPARGIILHGPPGTGKTLIARALASEVGAKFLYISGPEIYSHWYGKSEENLRNVFQEAENNAPAIVVIDELDSLVPRRDRSHGDQEQRIVATFLAQMDGLKQMRGVVVIGTTNRINEIDPALRRGGRFECEIHIGVPDVAGRRQVLGIHARRMPLSHDVDLDAVAEKAVGLVGADLAAVCREAAYIAVRRRVDFDRLADDGLPDHEGLTVDQSDFDNALGVVPPSAMKEFLVEIPQVRWADIGGLDDIKRLLTENIAYAITKREVFEKAGVRPARGILLYGSPGTGKTLLAKAVAHECGANFISVRGPEMRSKWVGESEERIRSLFAKAREVAPCVVFFDEIDAAAPSRGHDTSGVSDMIVNQMLSEIDGVQSTEGVLVMGATNRVELVDPALLRPGRFDYQVEVPLPDEASREAILRVHLRDKPLADSIDHAGLTRLTDGLSGAEIAGVCREATWIAIREVGFDAEKVLVTQAHLEQAIAIVRENARKLKPKGRIGFRVGGDDE